MDDQIYLTFRALHEEIEQRAIHIAQKLNWMRCNSKKSFLEHSKAWTKTDTEYETNFIIVYLESYYRCDSDSTSIRFPVDYLWTEETIWTKEEKARLKQEQEEAEENLTAMVKKDKEELEKGERKLLAELKDKYKEV